jgi:hypothetical protein
MQGEEEREEVSDFLFESVPHFFLDIGKCKQLLLVEHGETGNEFHKFILTTMSFPLFLHGDPAFSLRLLPISDSKCLSFCSKVDIGVTDHEESILQYQQSYEFLIFNAIQMAVMHDSLGEGLQERIQLAIPHEIKMGQGLF